VEHTSINPNKTPHIGHLRNSVIGDTFARLCKTLGYDTIVHNYIDNTGIQVADVVIGLTAMRGMSLNQIKDVGERLDRFCWDVYADMNKWYEDDPNRKSMQTIALKQMEEGRGPFADAGEYVSSVVTRAHLKLMEKLDIKYDLIVWERDVLALDLWRDTFEQLKSKGKLFLAEDGEKLGCWVMDLKESSAFSEMDNPDKILVRSNGTITYTAKDIAYHFWKCGLLKKDFQYQAFYEYKDSGIVWTTTGGFEEKKPPRKFNSADIAINVIDERQSYPQKVVQEAVRTVNADIILQHFAYGMVALSPACAEELGIELAPEDKGKKYIEMSGRRGLGVKADDLIDILNHKAKERIRQNLPDLGDNAIEEIAEKITIGALRYFLIKFNKNKVIAFDFDEALNFEGDAGPYIQYSIVRSGSIIKKAVETGVITEAKLVYLLKEWDFKYIKEVEEAELTWEFLFNLSRFDDILRQAFNSLDLSLIAGWAYDMAQSFNSYYHKYSILKETDTHLQLLRLGIVSHYKNIMTGIAGILGLPIPDKM
jgi:arginyl-tRNA synthetase